MTQAQHKVLWAENKSAIVAARRCGDEGLAAILSQERERLKKHRWCADCGVPLSSSAWRVRADRCAMHSNIAKFYKRQLNGKH